MLGGMKVEILKPLNNMMCTWLTEQQFKLYSQCSDKEVNEVLQEVRKFEPIWFVDQRQYEVERWLRKPLIRTYFTLYQIYQGPYGNSSYPEVRVQSSISTKNDLLNFLYGLNVGYNHSFNPPTVGNGQ